MSLIIDINVNENNIEILPKGELDIRNSPTFKEKVKEKIIKERKNLIINCEQLEYLDSTGLGAFMCILKTTQDYCVEIKLINIMPNIMKLFDITGLKKIFNIEE